MLLDVFSDPTEHLNIPDDEGFTPLHYTCMFNDVVGTRLLLSKSAEPNVICLGKLTALDYAIYNFTSSAWKTSSTDQTFNNDANAIIDMLLAKKATVGPWKIDD